MGVTSLDLTRLGDLLVVLARSDLASMKPKAPRRSRGTALCQHTLLSDEVPSLTCIMRLVGLGREGRKGAQSGGHPDLQQE